MKIEKTYKLTIKDQSFDLNESEVNALYQACRDALNIPMTLTSPYSPIVRPNPPFEPMTPSWPNPWGTTYPSIPNMMSLTTGVSTEGVTLVKDKVDIRHPDDR